VNERRALWLLILALVIQLVLLGAQVTDPTTGGSRLEAVLLRSVAPLARMVASVGDLAGSIAYRFTLRKSLIADNERLRAEVESLRRERAQLFGIQRDLDRLSEAVGYTPPLRGELRVADIVYVDHVSWLQTLLLYTGDASVEANQPVVSGDGLVGRVIVVPGPYAKVQLITDRAASIGAMVERTRRQGIVRGSGQGSLELAFVPLQADVRVGDRVVTAGIDGIYARGIPIGTVTAVAPGDELFHSIELNPEVDFGRLDQVYVLEREPVPEAAREALPEASPESEPEVGAAREDPTDAGP
jgi:rod shape-determining protein MreC